MPWFRVEGKLSWHAKVVRAGNAAVGAWTRLGAWCADNRTDGKVPSAMVVAIALPCELEALLEVVLLERDGDDYQVHDYLEYNMSAAEDDDRRAALSAKRSEAGKKGAAARWGKRATAGANRDKGHSKSHGKPQGKSDGTSHSKSHGKPMARSRSRDPIPSTDPDADDGATHARAREPVDPTTATAGECLNVEADQILTELRRWPALASIATVAFAEGQSNWLIGGGRKLVDLALSIEQIAEKARNADAVGEAIPPRDLANYCGGAIRRGPIHRESDRRRTAELDARKPPATGWNEDDEPPPLPPVMQKHLERTADDDKPDSKPDGMAAIAKLAKASQA